MKRVFLVVLDSLGIGYSDDAYKFGDKGANTLGNIAKYCFFNRSFSSNKKYLFIPNLVSLGIGEAFKRFTKKSLLGFEKKKEIIGSYGYASEISSGKDTTSGHWEIVGSPVLFDWYYFKKKNNTFPEKLLRTIEKLSKVNSFIGNCHASGTDIIKDLGEVHIKTKSPIIYTSADSVVQIACHEKFFGLMNLYQLCKIVRKILDNQNYKVSRVIARPFIGENKNSFIRTGNRKDFSLKPNSITVMEKLISENNGSVIAIGKVSDIFANVGITKSVKSIGMENLFDSTIKEIKKTVNNSKDVIIFTNFVDFDSEYGHRRDIKGYARALERFDKRLIEIISLVRKNDLLIITADHGCDPSWTGSDHTRENIPILLYKKNIVSSFLGHRQTFSDIAQTIADFFSLSSMKYGISLFSSK